MSRRLLCTLLALGLTSVLFTAQTPKVLNGEWTRTGMIAAAGLSYDGSCVAITTASFVAVLDRKGQELWRWDFAKENRFVFATKVAVAPECDWLVFAGGVGYRYVWFIHRSGTRKPIPTEGTPLAVEIDHNGTLAAVGTGAGIVYLYDADGTQRWKNNVGGAAPVQELSFAEDGSAIMLRSWGQAVISIDGRTRWAGGVWGSGSSRPATDFKKFLAWGEPPHGPGIGSLALIDEDGKVIWRRYASYPRGIISDAGDLVVARTNDNQNPTEEDGYSPRREELAGPLRLIAGEGSVVRTFEGQGEPTAFAADGRRFLIETKSDIRALDLEGRVLWTVPLSASVESKILTTRDLHTVVVLSGGDLEWFSTP